MKLVVPVATGFESNLSPVVFWSRGCVAAIAGWLPEQVFPMLNRKLQNRPRLMARQGREQRTRELLY
ncbi:MAG TPA: hypothetical protein VFW28_07285 [Micropepsaceae bacterium]|nr:hypothetical protein [Micropepsaceae bacterium]